MSPLPPQPDSRFTVETRSADETRRLAVTLTPLLLPGDALSLSGGLGSGKTTFVQGIAAGLGVPERVTSPSFVLMKEYSGRYPLLHLDVFRLKTAQEVLDLGYEEFMDPSHVVVVEWGDMIEPLLPREHLMVAFEMTGESTRHVSFTPLGERWVSSIETISILCSELFSPDRETSGER